MDELRSTKYMKGMQPKNVKVVLFPGVEVVARSRES